MDMDGDEDDAEAQMAAMLGFSGFGTTKQKKVQGNNVGSIAKHKTTEYRQYMYVHPVGPLIWRFSADLRLGTGLVDLIGHFRLRDRASTQ